MRCPSAPQSACLISHFVRACAVSSEPPCDIACAACPATPAKTPIVAAIPATRNACEILSPILPCFNVVLPACSPPIRASSSPGLPPVHRGLHPLRLELSFLPELPGRACATLNLWHQRLWDFDCLRANQIFPNLHGRTLTNANLLHRCGCQTRQCRLARPEPLDT